MHLVRLPVTMNATLPHGSVSHAFIMPLLLQCLQVVLDLRITIHLLIAINKEPRFLSYHNHGRVSRVLIPTIQYPRSF
jgi:hypothetical protein